MQKTIYLCPVCGKKMNSDCDYLEGILCEYSDVCPDLHYTSDFAYGGWRVTVGEQKWSGGFNDDKPHDEIDAAIEALKNKLGYA